MNALDQLIVALDFSSRAAAVDMVDRLEGSVRWFKVGLELFLAEGHSIVEELAGRGLQVFLDLKLHDIPTTVANATRVAAGMGASLLTVHAAGGPAMLGAAVQAAPRGLRLLAVTVLTSIDRDDLAATGITSSTDEQVLRLGELATAAGVHGLVCSPHEITTIRSGAAQDLQLVVPGIRPVSYTATDDQRRTSSASEAIRLGADMLVVGRPVTRAADPRAAACALLDEIAAAQRA